MYAVITFFLIETKSNCCWFVMSSQYAFKMLQSISKKYSGVWKTALRQYPSFFPKIGSNWLILNISSFLNQFPSNLGSDYLYMFKKNSCIYWHFSLPETQGLYYSLLNQEYWIISILRKISAPLSSYKTKT
jgi:hypothetical protein